MKRRWEEREKDFESHQPTSMVNISLKCFMCFYFLSLLNYDDKFLKETENMSSDALCPLILCNSRIAR